jgi:SAM-dependent methyltransferase
MNENPEASDWVAARGEKWRAQLSGMEAMLAPLDPVLIEALRLDAPCRIAEIGCGGGGTAREILRRAPAGSVVHGFDISPPLIELARKHTISGPPALAFEIADMAAAPPPAELYDRLASRFGVMFFDDPPAAFANLFRWLAPGGRCAFAVWSRMAENPWMATVRDVVAATIDLPPADPLRPGPFRYADAAKLLHLLQGAGFADLEVRDWRGLLPIGGELPPAGAAQFALSAFASFAELLAQAGREAFNTAHRALTERFSQHQQDGVVRMDACVHILTGRRLD